MALQTTQAPPSDGMSTLYIALAVLVVIIVGIFLYVLRKGRRMNGDHVFRASRFGVGNRIFPAQVMISPSSITLYKPQWIGKLEESIHMAHVASIKIDTNLMFSDVFIETSGGQDPIVCHGHTKADAVEMKRLIERFQSEYYKAGRTNGPVAPAPSAPTQARP
jgi:hypothetical protein